MIPRRMRIAIVQRRGLWAAMFIIVLAAVFAMATNAQQGKVSDADLKNLAMSAKTAQDHMKLGAHYRAHAAEHEADAKLHEQLANQYDKSSPQLAGEARHYAAHSMEAAEALRNLAQIHDTMAKAAK
jgi:hypothetical protein